jgi:small subunit ribosomal protein S1
VLETYHEGDEVEGKVTKVVTFGAFVEIMPGVEGLVHISELAQHHVENPREVVSQGDLVKARIIEVDAERRRLSLSLKRIDGGGVTEHADDAEAVEGTPNIGLSEEVFPETGEPQAELVDEAPAEVPEPEADGEAEADAPVVAPAPEELDASIEADQASPDEQGPGDSEGSPPAPPD